MSGKYDDIIGLPHHVSPRRARMSMTDRAAQFSPFAALTGYEALIDETARLTDERQELSEHRKMVLDEALTRILDRAGECPRVRLTRFRADLTKEGGTYLTQEVRIKKVDLYARTVTTTDGLTISMDDLWELEAIDP